MRVYKEGGMTIIEDDNGQVFQGATTCRINNNLTATYFVDGLEVQTARFADIFPKTGSTPIGTDNATVIAYNEENLVFSTATGGSVATPIQSTNLVYHSETKRIIGTIPTSNALTTTAEGISLEIPVSDSEQYFLCRKGFNITGTPSAEQYKVMGAHYKSATGTLIQVPAADRFNSSNTLRGKLITPPAGAVKLVIVLKTNLTDLTGRLSLQKATSNFCLNVEPDYVIPKIIKQITPAIINDVRVEGDAPSSGQMFCRTEIISVKDESVVHVETGFVTGKNGALIAMYDENMTFIGQVTRGTGSFDGFSVKNNIATDPVMGASTTFISLDTSNFAHFAVCSYATSGTSYVIPKIYMEETRQVLKPEVGKIKFTNLTDPTAGGTRKTFKFRALTEDNQKILFTVSDLFLAKGLGFDRYDDEMVDKVTGGVIGTKQITEFGITNYFAFRCKIGGVQDSNFAGHNDTVITDSFEIHNENGLIYSDAGGYVTPGKYVNEGSYFKVIQTGKIQAWFTPRVDVKTFRLIWNIYADGTIHTEIDTNITAATFEYTLNYSIMGLTRPTAALTNIKFDAIQFTGGVVQTVLSNPVRAFYESISPLSGVLIDPVNDFKTEFDFFTSSTNLQNITGAKLSFQSETGFSKMYRIWEVGPKNIGDKMHAESVLKFSKI